MKKLFILLVLFSIVSCAGKDDGSVIPGKKIKIDEVLYFSVTFNKKPALGMVIVNIKLIDKSGIKVSSYSITGMYGMPAMRGAHDSPEIEFKQNRKGDYLLPVNVVMPGDWDILIKIKKNGMIIFNGTIKFNV